MHGAELSFLSTCSPVIPGVAAVKHVLPRAFSHPDIRPMHPSALGMEGGAEQGQLERRMGAGLACWLKACCDICPTMPEAMAWAADMSCCRSRLCS